MKNLILLVLLMFGLVACHGSDENNIVVSPTPTPDPTPNPAPDPTPDPTPIPDPVPNQLKNLAAQDANDEAGVIGNADDLREVINALFDGDEPLEIENGESLTDAIDRAEDG